MASDLVLVAVGLVALVLAGDALVRGAVALSLRLGIPALIVSLTVVAFGTSAPEMVVSVVAVVDGAPALALGNVVGSNIANVLLVLGLPALMVSIRTDEGNYRRDYLFMLGITVLFIGLAFAGPIRWPQALLLLCLLVAMMTSQVRAAVTFRARPPVPGEEDIELVASPVPMPGLRMGLLLALGLVGLPLGAHFLVEGATGIARGFGISEAVIGLTLVAVGTSLPELATSVAAALKGRADVALGNVIGSNIFNVLAIVGVAGLLGPLPMPPQLLLFDLWVMLAASLLLGPIVFRGLPIGRGSGAVLVAAYAGYLGALALGVGQ
ncbi:MAG: calcium/sodium antiporter [Phaeovulum sp.]|uniref:calcium/sodium antiporter n=1 Tax=Phaeovulum sp. TaxID=2934796 RepID=UPI0027318387|nr:calcium/sodium antiporter [Phaeovulum sp.]MDP2063496.1 calcium/sodium antiporter [Phaeovulum sp.]